MIPPKITAPVQPQPTRSPIAAPGSAFTRKSTIPALQCSRSVEPNSRAEYSNPSSSSSSSAPICAPVLRKAPLKSRDSTPPFPNTSPAIRNSGTEEILSLKAIKEMIPRNKRIAPNSVKIKESLEVNPAALS